MITWIGLTLLWPFLIFGTDALSILTIENRNAGEYEDDGRWGEWSKWHPCSRSCGGGITYMQRECQRSRVNNINTECDGPARMYTSCSIQDCPVNSEDFRSKQCAEYNNVTYHGKKYEWIPYIGDRNINPCELHCQPKTGEFHAKHADMTTDGTRCRSSGYDACVEGTCEAVGCDMILGSELKLDVCGECDGDGSSCFLVRRSITTKLPAGYVPLITIPPGATNIQVQERKGTRNYLAVRDSGKRYVLNGQWQLLKSNSIIRVAGSDLIYIRKSDRKRASERIEITGPITEMIYIDVSIQERNRGIDYKFYLPRGTRNPNIGGYEWFAGQWQNCSMDCGKGIQRRRVLCKNSHNGEKVLNYLCNTRRRPPSSTECNTHPCETSWSVGHWSTCTQRCGGNGIQVRQVNCIETRGGINSSVLLHLNENCFATKPDTKQSCGFNECSDWTVGNWSTCSSTCGHGIQTRQVTCPQNDCLQVSMPIKQQSCNIRPCTGIDWVTTKWSECIGGCKDGVQTREVICVTEENIRYPARMCDTSRKPASLQNCYLDSLCPEKATWVSEEWSECSVTCGHGIQTRRVICAIYESGNYRALSDDNCASHRAIAKPSTAQDCFSQNCSHNWYTGPWGPCSVSCQGGIRTRVVLCVSSENESASDDLCNSANIPTDSEICNKQNCVYNTPDLRQVDCHHSNYGCCPDGITSATGPFQASCDLPPCRETRFGCCPDGVNRPTGDRFEGCPSVSESPTQIPRQALVRTSTTIIPTTTENCRLAVDPGTCDDWEVHWFFDVRSGQCDRFWFGGCGGNGNRFQTSEICSQVCEKYIRQHHAEPEFSETVSTTHTQLTSTTSLPITTTKETITEPTIRETDSNSLPSYSPDFDILPAILPVETPPKITKPDLPSPSCFLRRSSGPCESKHHRWYFDGTTGTCLSFWYGGCAGNENNFASEGNCLDTCGNKPLPTFERGLGQENTPPIPVNIKPGRQEVYAQVGKMARLACMAEGSPNPTVVWNKLDLEFPLESERMETLEDNSLLISQITSKDAGSYECIASNGHGPNQRLTVKLIVKDRVLIRETPSNTTINVGEPAALRCRIHDDVFFVTWQKDGEKVQSNEYYNVQPWGDLHILHADIEDSGLYTCTAYANNVQQSASAALVVSQKEQSSTPTTTRLLSANPVDRHCRDYPEYANCNIVVLKRMCHKHNYQRYCCASCGGRPQSPLDAITKNDRKWQSVI